MLCILLSRFGISTIYLRPTNTGLRSQNITENFSKRKMLYTQCDLARSLARTWRRFWNFGKSPIVNLVILQLQSQYASIWTTINHNMKESTNGRQLSSTLNTISCRRPRRLGAGDTLQDQKTSLKAENLAYIHNVPLFLLCTLWEALSKK